MALLVKVDSASMPSAATPDGTVANPLQVAGISGATGVAQGSATSGQTGDLMQAAVTTTPPSYTTAQTDPLSMDTAGNLRTTASPFPSGATQLSQQTATANANAVATLTSAAARTAYLCGLQIGGLGATAAGGQFVQVTGLEGGTLSFAIGIPAGVGVPLIPPPIVFNPPLRASATNTNIVATFFAAGAGNTSQSVTAWGFMI